MGRCPCVNGSITDKPARPDHRIAPGVHTSQSDCASFRPPGQARGADSAERSRIGVRTARKDWGNKDGIGPVARCGRDIGGVVRRACLYPAVAARALIMGTMLAAKRLLAGANDNQATPPRHLRHRLKQRPPGSIWQAIMPKYDARAAWQPRKRCPKRITHALIRHQPKSGNSGVVARHHRPYSSRDDDFGSSPSP